MVVRYAYAGARSGKFFKLHAFFELDARFFQVLEHGVTLVLGGPTRDVHGGLVFEAQDHHLLALVRTHSDLVAAHAEETRLAAPQVFADLVVDFPALGFSVTRERVTAGSHVHSLLLV